MNLGRWLNIGDFHDKEIIAVEISAQHDITLSVYDESDGSTVKITFMGTLRMRLDDLLERNIILDVTVYESNEIDELNDELLYLLNLDLSNLLQPVTQSPNSRITREFFYFPSFAAGQYCHFREIISNHRLRGVSVDWIDFRCLSNKEGNRR